MLKPSDYFDLSEPSVAALFQGVDQVWEVVSRLPTIVANLVGDERKIQGEVSTDSIIAEGPVIISPGAVIEPGVYIMPPAYIGPGAVIRHGAYVRPNSVMLKNTILGHASELKSSLMLPGSQAPHFAYVGDSVLGSHVNLGAGTKLSNVPITVGHLRGNKVKKNIRVECDGEEYDTGIRKLGAILGDEVQTGCNSVLNPGTFIGPRTLVYPNAVVGKGFYPGDSIVKLSQQLAMIDRIYARRP